MATRVPFDAWFSASPQTAEGTYDPTLAGITSSISGDPDGTDDGLLIGAPGTGVAGTGIALTMGRRAFREQNLAGSLTRTLSEFINAEVPTLEFSFPFVGSLRTLDSLPQFQEFRPLRGVEAILNGAGFALSSSSYSGVGFMATLSAQPPFSVLLWYSGNRVELMDCLTSSLRIEFKPGAVPVATARIEVGSVREPVTGWEPEEISADYGAQATAQRPTLEASDNTWGSNRGFASLTLTIENTLQRYADTNTDRGYRESIVDRRTLIELELAADSNLLESSGAETFELNQIAITTSLKAFPLSFDVGSDGVAFGLAQKVHVGIKDVEVERTSFRRVGNALGNRVTGHAVAGSAQADGEIWFTFN